MVSANVGCGDQADLGNYLIWAADHETGSSSQWDPGPDADGTSIVDSEVSDEHAHSGSYALLLTGSEGEFSYGAGFDFNTAREAYFSAWFYLPEAPTGLDPWTILQFASRGSGCPGPGETCAGIDVQLRSLVSGDVLFYLLSHEPDVLQPPLSDPPYYLPVERWFQVEVLYKRATDHTGRFHVWVNGVPLFRFEGWRTADFDNLFWGLGNPSEAGAELYVDDAAISLIPVTPTGSFQ